MEERNEISVELNALSALVGGISRQTPYRVPVGYFDALAANLINRIAGNSSLLQTRSSAFQVPDDYFDGFAAQVLARIKAERGESVSVELAGLSSTVSRISRVTPYQVPEGYWEELCPLLAVLRDKPAYALPEGYFDELSPVLTVAHDRSTYRVPEGYFGGLPGQILEKVVPHVIEPVAAARIIPMEREAGRPMERANTGKVLKGNWWKYSSAAAIAACFLLIFSWPKVDNKAPERAMTPDITQALHKVSNQEMEAYLDDQPTLLTDPVNNSTATLDMNEGEVKSLLGDVSDKDLQQYMEEHGKADDLATN